MAARKLVLEGRVSLSAFLAGLSVLLIPLIRTWFGHVDWVFDYLTEMPGKVAICLHVLVVNGLLLLLYRGPVYKVRLDRTGGGGSRGDAAGRRRCGRHLLTCDATRRDAVASVATGRRRLPCPSVGAQADREVVRRLSVNPRKEPYHRLQRDTSATSRLRIATQVVVV